MLITTMPDRTRSTLIWSPAATTCTFVSDSIKLFRPRRRARYLASLSEQLAATIPLPARSLRFLCETAPVPRWVGDLGGTDHDEDPSWCARGQLGCGTRYRWHDTFIAGQFPAGRFEVGWCRPSPTGDGRVQDMYVPNDRQLERSVFAHRVIRVGRTFRAVSRLRGSDRPGCVQRRESTFLSLPAWSASIEVADERRV